MFDFIKKVFSNTEEPEVTKPVQSTSLEKLYNRVNELILHISDTDEDINMPVRIRARQTVETRTATVQSHLIELYNLAKLVEETDRSRKYIDEVPDWFISKPKLRPYDTYMIVNDSFITESELVLDLKVVLDRIMIGLSSEHNIKLRNYYHTKLNKVYTELLYILNTF